MSNSIVSYPYGPFLTHDLDQTYGAKYLEPSDIAHASQVCKQWKLVFSDQNLWKALSKKEGIPLVKRANGEVLNCKETFQVLYPITLSGRKISQYIGTVYEEIPYISEERFNELNEPDSYETGKLKKETWVFVVVPSYVLRTASQDTPLALDEEGNLVENQQTAATEKKQLKISLSLKNLKILCSYPLRGKENTPVFDEDSSAEVFNQCNTCPDKVRVYFMRKHIADQSRGMNYFNQVELVKRHGFEVTPLRERSLFDSITILDSGTCPDDRNPPTYARNPDTVRNGGRVYQSVIGGFTRSGVLVSCSNDAFVGIGVVPGVPAEVPAIGTERKRKYACF